MTLTDIFLTPWQVDPQGYGWIVAMAFFVSLACGLVGTFLLLRKMALMGDAISHSVLPGIAAAFILSGSRDIWPMFLGAITAGVLCGLIVEGIQRFSRIKSDAALGATFTTFFAIGIILISFFADSVDLDADCVLYGEIAYIPFEELVTILGIEIPRPLALMAGICLGVVLLITLFYKELVVTSFDRMLAQALGIPESLIRYGLLLVLTLVIVSAFESVGAILVVALLVFPGATGLLLTDRLPVILGLCPIWSLIYSFAGLHFAIALDASIPGAMVTVGFVIFFLVWVFSPRFGLIGKWLKPREAHVA